MKRQWRCFSHHLQYSQVHTVTESLGNSYRIIECFQVSSRFPPFIRMPQVGSYELRCRYLSTLSLAFRYGIAARFHVGLTPNDGPGVGGLRLVASFSLASDGC